VPSTSVVVTQFCKLQLPLMLNFECRYSGDKSCCEHVILQPNVFREWFEEQTGPKRTLQAGSVRSYIASIKHFLQFLKQNMLILSLPQTFQIQLSVLITRMGNYSACLEKDIKKRKFDKQELDHVKLLEFQDMENFAKSPYVTSILHELSTAEELRVGPKRCVELRNVLLSCLVLSTFQRSGAISNMTIEEFNSAERIEQGGQVIYVCRTKNHKTYSSHGVANLPVKETLYKAIQTYIKFLRPKSNPDKTDANGETRLFMTLHGEVLDTSLISVSVRSAWSKSGVGKQFGTITNFRKSMVTHCHRNDPAMVGQLAISMSHR
jgi:integrase